MKNCNTGRFGFTLIELLVVVLIIGILATVALPQYQLAVDKSHIHKLIVISAKVRAAEELYYTANGTYTSDWDSLDIDLPTVSGQGTQQRNLADGTVVTLSAKREEGKLTWAGVSLENTQLLQGVSIISYYTYHPSASRKDNSWCYADKTNARANRLCQSICKSQLSSVDEGRNICVMN